MSTQEERDLRSDLIQARQRRSTVRFQETLAAITGITLAVVAFVAGPDVPLLSKHLLCYGGAALLVVAAFYNLYGKVIIQPNLADLESKVSLDD